MTCSGYHLPIPGGDEAADKTNVGNVREKWKVGFSNLTQLTDNFTQISAGAGDLIFADGNVAGSSYIDICKCALTPGTETVYLAKKAFRVPYVADLGIGFSQRFNGQDFYAEWVAVNADADGNVISVKSTNSTPPASNALSANITVATNVWTVTLTDSVWTYIRPGDWITISGCADSRLNVGKVLVTAIGAGASNVINISSTLADGTYTGWTGGVVNFVCPCGYADLVHSTNFYGTSNSNADTISRNGVEDSTGNNNRARVTNWNPGNTQFDSAVPNEGGFNYATQKYTRPFRAKGNLRVEHVTGSLLWLTKDQDSTSAVRSTSFRESEVPAQDQWYALRLRAVNLPNLSVLVGTNRAITAISKSGSTTWTVTCPGHGLTVNDRVRIYGVRDQTNFANIATDTAVNSVIDANQFTIISTTGTATSYGGWVIRVNGGAVPTVSAISVQSYHKSFDSLRLVLTGNTTWVGTYGNIVDLQGLVNSSNAHIPELCGKYRIARISTTTIELDPMEGQAAAIAAITGTVNAGGTFIQNTSMRIHYARVIDYFRMLLDTTAMQNVEARAFPTRVVAGSIGATQSTRATVGSGWYVEPDNLLVNDIASAAITGTTTSGTITPTPVGGAAVFNVVVTSSSGTTPTLDVSVEESDDTATNWYRIYDFPRITGNDIYRSPQIPLNGNRIRYVRTVGGTSPSFTMAVNRIIHQMVTPTKYRQRFDRAVSLTTLNATTVDVWTGGAGRAQLVFNVGAIITTAPQLQIEGSDDNGVSWYAIGSPLTAVDSSTVQLTVTGIVAERIRARVSTAGVGVTAGYVLIRSYGDPS